MTEISLVNLDDLKMVKANTELMKITGIISDLDGVTYRGQRAIESAVRAFQRWYDDGVPYAFVTNNSTKTPGSFAEKLTRMGIPAEPSKVVTSAQVAAQKAAQNVPLGARVYVVGSKALQEEIEQQGLTVAETDVEAVVVGLDRQFDFKKLRQAQTALLNGACFIGTNPDPMLPSDDGFEPGAGAILRAIETASGVSPTIVGKPKPDMVTRALEILGTDPATTYMIGDQIKTDIYAGQAAGLSTVYVKTGVQEQGPFRVAPDITVETLEALHI